MSVRAKFVVSSIVPNQAQRPDFTCMTIHMHAVYGDGTGNETWSKATPNGSLTMVVTNPDAIAQFEQGKAYFLDFTPAD